jgi:DNA topoisomerase-1
MEKTLKTGIYLECPNKKKVAEEEAAPKKRGKKAVEPVESTVVCSYSKRIGDAPPPPTAETHGPVPEKESEKASAKVAAKETVKKAAKKTVKKTAKKQLLPA